MLMRFADGTNLKYGLAGFWLQNQLQCSQKNDLRVYQTYHDARPFAHVINLTGFMALQTKDTSSVLSL